MVCLVTYCRYVPIADPQPMCETLADVFLLACTIGTINMMIMMANV